MFLDLKPVSDSRNKQDRKKDAKRQALASVRGTSSKGTGPAIWKTP